MGHHRTGLIARAGQVDRAFSDSQGLTCHRLNLAYEIIHYGEEEQARIAETMSTAALIT
jgi:hypothetical protein